MDCFDEDFDEDYGYPFPAIIDLPISVFGGGSQHWIDELYYGEPIIGYDPQTANPIYERDCSFVGYDRARCDFNYLEDIPF